MTAAASARLAPYQRLLVVTLAVVVSFSYGALFYGFSVLITQEAAGGVFSTGLLSTAFGGAVITGGMVAVPVGRFADRHGIAGILVTGGVLSAAGLAVFAWSQQGWQVLAAWWVLLGPATAMTFYEPAYVAIQQWFDDGARIRAIALLTFLAGLSGPVSIPMTTALVEAYGWRTTAYVLGAAVFVATALAALVVVRFAPKRPQPTVDGSHPGAGKRHPLPLLSARFLLFTVAGMLAYGSLDAIIVHRVARFEEAGFLVATVAGWAAISGMLSIPGRYLLPSLARHFSATALLTGVFVVMAAAIALAVHVSGQWQLVSHFLVFGLVFGAALPLRAVVMGQWYSTAYYGAIMGVQAAAIAVARAAFPLGVGVLRDVHGGYEIGFALLAAALTGAAILMVISARPRPSPDPLLVRQKQSASPS